MTTDTLREAAARAAHRFGLETCTGNRTADGAAEIGFEAGYLAGYEAAKAESAIAAEPPCCGNCAKRHSEICVDTVNDYDDPCDEYERRPQ